MENIIPEDVHQRLVDATADVFDIQDVTPGYARGQGIRLRGRLRLEAEKAYEIVAPRFEALGYTALFRREGDLHVILAEPGLIRAKKLNVWVNLVLFVLTLASVLLTGVTVISPAQDSSFGSLWPGLAFAVGLLAVLGAHEMSHYFVARHFGVPISLPYFIPFPLTLFGTMGATEIMQGRPKNRRALLAVGAAGPLAGVVLAIPVLILGLFLSKVQPIPTDGSYFVEGNSLLYLAIKYLMFGRILPGGGYDVFIHPIVFAGWGGLLVTALNLIPAGQLDGGHVLYALLGKRSRLFAWPILIALIILGTRWAGWYLWAALIFFLGRAYAEPLDEITELGLGERILAIGMMILFVLVFVPVPFQMG
jgi:membrane-associated protease RseP (regulator of RpoE activity)